MCCLFSCWSSSLWFITTFPSGLTLAHMFWGTKIFFGGVIPRGTWGLLPFCAQETFPKVPVIKFGTVCKSYTQLIKLSLWHIHRRFILSDTLILALTLPGQTKHFHWMSLRPMSKMCIHFSLGFNKTVHYLCGPGHETPSLGLSFPFYAAMLW